MADIAALDRLKSQLLVSGLQQRDNPLYQVINQLIGFLRETVDLVDGVINPSGGGGGSIGSQSFVTINNDQASLPNSRRIVAGNGINFNNDGQKLTIHSAVPIITIEGEEGPMGPPGMQGIQGIQGMIGPQGLDGICDESNELIYPPGYSGPYFDPYLVRTTGIIFPGNPIPNSDINALDDYKEGSWSPTLTASGGSSGQTYAAQNGYYEKIGRHVTVYFFLQLTNAGTLTGSVQIGNLPYTSDNLTNLRALGIMSWANTATAFIAMFGAVVPNANVITISGLTAAATSVPALTQANIANNTILVGSLTYPTIT